MKNKKKILVMGLPGAGKTTLAKALAPLLPAVHLNADEVRANIHKDLGFSVADRIENARRMGWLCDAVTSAGGYAIADFICPTRATRQAFGVDDAFVIWLDRVREGRFEDTNRLFEPPTRFDLRVGPEGTPQYWAERAAEALAGGAARGKRASVFEQALSYLKHELLRAKLGRLAGTVLLTLAALFLTSVADGFAPYNDNFVALYLAAGLAGWMIGAVGGLAASALSVLAVQYLWMPPAHSFAVDAAHLPRFLEFVLCAIVSLAIGVALRRRPRIDPF